MEHAMDIRDVKITKLEADNMILQVIISYNHILIEIMYHANMLLRFIYERVLPNLNSKIS